MQKEYIIKAIIILCCLLSLAVIDAPSIFLFFSALSLALMLAGIYKSDVRFDYFSSLLLVLCMLGFKLDFFASAICFVTGMFVLSLSISLHRDISWDDFTISFLSILGFWIIYYKFEELGTIAFLLGINTTLLIFFLSYSLIEELDEVEKEPIEVDIEFLKNLDYFKLSVVATIVLAVAYYLSGSIEFKKHLETLTVFSALVSLYLLVRKIKKKVKSKSQ